MNRVWRRPIAWMVAAEIIVVASLTGLAWHELAGAGRAGPPPLVLPATSTPHDTAAPDVPADAIQPPGQSAPLLLPGLNVDPAFWRDRLVGLNAAEAQFEALEWKIVHSAMQTVQRYVDTVVVPAIEHAEKGGA